MERFEVTTTAGGKAIMESAAAYAELPLSLWARTVLLAEARAVAHAKLCATPKPAVKKPMSKADRDAVVSSNLAADFDQAIARAQAKLKGEI